MILIAAFAIYVIITKRLRITRSTTLTGPNARNFGICLLVLLVPFRVAVGELFRVVLPVSARFWPIPEALFFSLFATVVIAMAYYFRDQSFQSPAPSPEPASSTCMAGLREYDVVRVVRLDTPNRSYDGTKSVMRPPQVGDVASICHVYKPEDPTAPVAVEMVAEDGGTIWLADFSRGELELVSRP